MVPKWSYNRTMPVNLSIKNVPDEVVERLRARASANRRSLQGELLAIVERVAAESSQRRLTIREVFEWAKTQGFSGTGNAAADIRAMRDDRARHVDRVLQRARRAHISKAAVKTRGRR